MGELDSQLDQIIDREKRRGAKGKNGESRRKVQFGGSLVHVLVAMGCGNTFGTPSCAWPMSFSLELASNALFQGLDLFIRKNRFMSLIFFGYRVWADGACLTSC